MKLSKQSNIFRSMFFTGNVSKMRKALMKYLSNEGVKSTLDDGVVNIEFNSAHYGAEFEISDGLAECMLTFLLVDDDYEALKESDKTYIADKINTDKVNRTTVYTFNDSMKIVTRFYFTSRRMMLNLFVRHFEELVVTADDTMGLLGNFIDDNKKSNPKPMGFVGRTANDSSQEVSVAAESKQDVNDKSNKN